MNRRWFAGCMAAILVCVFSTVAFGRDTLVGTWKWKESKKAEHVLRITKATADTVEGTLTVGMFGGGPVMTRTFKITKGSYTDGVVNFTVDRHSSPETFKARLVTVQGVELLSGSYIVYPGQRPQRFDAKRG